MNVHHILKMINSANHQQENSLLKLFIYVTNILVFFVIYNINFYAVTSKDLSYLLSDYRVILIIIFIMYLVLRKKKE